MIREFGRWLMGEEHRQASYSDAFVSALLQQAGGNVTGDPSSLAVVEVAAGMVSRCISIANVTPSNERTAAITPAYLAAASRDMMRRGGHVSILDIGPAGLRFLPATSWDVAGNSIDPESWMIRANLNYPDGMQTRFLPFQQVAFPRFADPCKPWMAVAPLSWAASSAALVANMEKRLAEEASQPHGSVIPTPSGKATTQLQEDLAHLKGKAAFVTTMRGSGDLGQSPMADWKQLRIGFQPPQAEVMLRMEAEKSLLGAMGLGPSLLSAQDGTAQRESFRRLASSLLIPASALLEFELSRVLDTTVKLDLNRVMASDLTGRARGFRQPCKGRHGD